MNRTQVSVPQQNYRGSSHDALLYVDDYARANGLPLRTGLSKVEAECTKIAEKARQEYKERYCNKSSRAHCETRASHRTIEEKQISRLSSNRRAGRAHKVFTEVLMKLLSAHLLRQEQNISSTSESAFQAHDLTRAGNNTHDELQQCRPANWYTELSRSSSITNMPKRSGQDEIAAPHQFRTKNDTSEETAHITDYSGVQQADCEAATDGARILTDIAPASTKGGSFIEQGVLASTVPPDIWNDSHIDISTAPVQWHDDGSMDLVPFGDSYLLPE